MVSDAKKKREAAKKAKASAKLNGTTVSPSVSTNAVCGETLTQHQPACIQCLGLAVITTYNLQLSATVARSSIGLQLTIFPAYLKSVPLLAFCHTL